MVLVVKLLAAGVINAVNGARLSMVRFLPALYTELLFPPLSLHLMLQLYHPSASAGVVVIAQLVNRHNN